MIKLTAPFFPPTTNEAYYVRHGRMCLSKKGKKFKLELTTHLARTYPKEMKFFEKNVPYCVLLRLFFEDLENKGWPEKCDTRYKTFDATNRVKLAEDALKDAAGVDDSQFLAFVTAKHQAGPNMEPHIEFFAWNMETEVSPLDYLIRI
jgi:hypothetical protein